MNLYLTNKEASNVLCSVVTHAGNGRARSVRENTRRSRVFFRPYLLSALQLIKCISTEQSTVEDSLFVFMFKPNFSRITNLRSLKPLGISILYLDIVISSVAARCFLGAHFK